MHIDGKIRIENSGNVTDLIKFSYLTDHLKIQSYYTDLLKEIKTLYSLNNINNVMKDIKDSTKLIIASTTSMTNYSWVMQAKNLRNVMGNLCSSILQVGINEELKRFSDSIKAISLAYGNYNLLHIPYGDSHEKNIDDEEVNTEIISEIFHPDQEAGKSQRESIIITLSPINDKVLKYLSKNPEAFYQLSGSDFEIVMAEIYNKLGYKVECTQSTRDGGKDIIIRKPEILGDFIYYVECKKYAAKRHIGVGIIRNLIGTVDTDRVNGGILATTSFFSPDAKKFISENKYDYQIQMHDYDVIRDLLNMII